MNTLFGISDITVLTEYGKYKTDFQTPISVCKYMVSLIPNNTVTVLEPSPGVGNILSVLKNYKVTSPDDFFQMPADRFDCVVMNPPFSLKYTNINNAPLNADFKGMKMGYYFLNKCMQMSDNIIALMPWFTISDSDVRLRYLKQWGLISITALPRKTFEYARIQTCVLQMQKGFDGDTLFKVFDLLQTV